MAAAIPAIKGIAVWLGATAGAIGTGYYVAATAIYIASNIALAYLAKAIFSPSVGSALDEGRRDTIKSNMEFRKIVYGRDLVSGPILYADTNGSDNKFLNMVVVLTGHPIEEFEEIYLNDTKLVLPASFNDGNLVEDSSGEFEDADGNSLVKVAVEKGISPLDAAEIANGTFSRPSISAISGKTAGEWSSNHLAINCSFIFVNLTYDPEVFRGGIPHIRCLIKGKKVNTSAGDFKWTDNWADCVTDYIMDEALGFGSSDVDIFNSVNNAALKSDEWVKIGLEDDGVTDIYSYDIIAEQQESTLNAQSHNGYEVKFKDSEDGTKRLCTHQRRYTLNGTVSCREKPIDNIENMLTAAMGTLTYSSGLFKLYAGQYMTPDPELKLSEKDFIGSSLTVTASLGRAERNNVITGVFVNEEDFFNNADFPSALPQVIVDEEINNPSLTAIPTTSDMDALISPASVELGHVVKLSGNFTNSRTGTDYVLFVCQENDKEFGDSVTWVRYLNLSENDNPYQVEDNGEEFEKNVEFGYIHNQYRAQRVAKMGLDRSRQSITIEGKLNLRGFKFEPNQNIYVSLDRTGWKDKVFRLMHWQYSQEGYVDVSLVEDNPRIYQWKNGEAIIGGNRDNTNLGDLPPLDKIKNLDVVSSSYISSDGSTIGEASVFINPPDNTNWAVSGYRVDSLKINKGIWKEDVDYIPNELVRGSGSRDNGIGATTIYMSRTIHTSTTSNRPISSYNTWRQVFIWEIDVSALYYPTRVYLDPYNGKFYVIKGFETIPADKETPPSKDDRFELVVPASGESWINHGVYHSNPEKVEGTIKIGEWEYPGYEGYLTPIAITTQNDSWYLFKAKTVASSVARDSTYTFDEVNIKAFVKAPEAPVNVQLLNLVEDVPGTYDNGYFIRIDLSSNFERNISHFNIILQKEGQDIINAESFEYAAPSNLEVLGHYDIFVPSNKRAEIRAIVSITNTAGSTSETTASLFESPLPVGANLRGIWEVGVDYEIDDVVIMLETSLPTQFYSCNTAHLSTTNNKPPNEGYWDQMLDRQTTVFIVTDYNSINPDISMPVAADLIVGDIIFYNDPESHTYTDGTILVQGLTYVWDGTNLNRQQNRTFIQDTEPLLSDGLMAGDVWIYNGSIVLDITGNRDAQPGNTLRWDGSSWIFTSARTFVQITEPASAQPGDYWRRTNPDGTLTNCNDSTGGPPCGTLSVKDPANSLNNSDGWTVLSEAGLDGRAIVELLLFARAPEASPPSAPASAVFNFDSLTVSGITPAQGSTTQWQTSIPTAEGITNPDPVWVSTTFVSSSEADELGNATATNWTSPVLSFREGTQGQSVNIVFRYDSPVSPPATPTSSSGVPDQPVQWYDNPADDTKVPGEVLYSCVGTKAGPDANWIWTQPVQSEGTPGTPGDNGESIAEVYIYKKTNNATGNPGTPTGGSYSFDTGLTPPTGWLKTIPSANSDETVYVSLAVFSKDKNGIISKTTGWTFPRVAYRDSPSIDACFKLLPEDYIGGAPADSTTSPPSLWSTSVTGAESQSAPADYIIWTSIGRYKPDFNIWEWEQPTPLQGTPGTPGTPGSDGQSAAELYIYRDIAAGTTPSRPDSGTYTFSTNSLTNLPTGWGRNIPNTDNPVWVSTAFASSDNNTVDVSNLWSTPVKVYQQGASVDIIFKRSSSQPTTPTETTNPPNNTWYTSINSIPAGSDPVWSCFGKYNPSTGEWDWDTPVRSEGSVGGTPINLTGQDSITFQTASTKQINITFEIVGSFNYLDSFGATSCPTTSSVSATTTFSATSSPSLSSYSGTYPIATRIWESGDGICSVTWGQTNSVSRTISANTYSVGQNVTISANVGGASGITGETNNSYVKITVSQEA